MKFIKRSGRTRAKLSLILLDWSVRESFHLLHYLEQQDVDRDLFEVIIIEYYSRVSDAIKPFESQVDTWVLLEMPEECYYHKHLMYNAGIVLSRGEICMIGDSDAMVRPGFIRTILEAYKTNPDIVLHIDQFRNMRRDFYPFNYPSFDEVLGPGCINNVEGRTRGVADEEDPVHTRNYGACMCARRSDLIAIGGADEHIDYLGHICGPYDMTFRLVNLGRTEVWHDSEFTFHTWHPGQAGVDNYLGPDDGRHLSSTSLAVLCTQETRPFVENGAIRALRTGEPADENRLMELLVDPTRIRSWKRNVVENPALLQTVLNQEWSVDEYEGLLIVRDRDGRFKAASHAGFWNVPEPNGLDRAVEASPAEIRSRLAASLPRTLRLILALSSACAVAAQVFAYGYTTAKKALTAGRPASPSST